MRAVWAALLLLKQASTQSSLCTCSGYTDALGRGGACSHWSADSLPWCYVAKDLVACPSAQQSKSGIRWSYCVDPVDERTPSLLPKAAATPVPTPYPSPSPTPVMEGIGCRCSGKTDNRGEGWACRPWHGALSWCYVHDGCPLRRKGRPAARTSFGAKPGPLLWWALCDSNEGARAGADADTTVRLNFAGGGAAVAHLSGPFAKRVRRNRRPPVRRRARRPSSGSRPCRGRVPAMPKNQDTPVAAVSDPAGKQSAFAVAAGLAVAGCQ